MNQEERDIILLQLNCLLPTVFCPSTQKLYLLSLPPEDNGLNWPEVTKKYSPIRGAHGISPPGPRPMSTSELSPCWTL